MISKTDLEKEIKKIIEEDKKWICNGTLEAINILRLNGFVKYNNPDQPLYPY